MTQLGKSAMDDAGFITGDKAEATINCQKLHVEGPLIVNAGSRDAAGTVTVNGATPVTVSAPALSANSIVSFGLKTVGGTVGAIPRLGTVTPGTGFTVVATAGDTSVYNWIITDQA